LEETVKHSLKILTVLLLLSSFAKSETIEIHARRFAFAPSEITLKPGETVQFHLVSDDVPHSLVVPGLHIKQEVSKGHPADFTVTPSGPGDFPGECGRFCGSGHGSMRFTIHVKE
jgi:cytochrome c oxidase subunit II